MNASIRFFFCLLLIAGSTRVWAKDPAANSAEVTTPKGWKFTVASVGAGQSFYTPDLGYWNTQSEIRYWDTKFSTMRLWGGNVEFGIYDHVNLRAEGSYATATARQSVVSQALGGGTQSKTISLVPVSAIVLYEFFDGEVRPYLGGGAGTVFVNSSNELNRTSGVVSGTSNSTDYMYYAVGGVKLPAARNLYLGVEARGAFGGYRELVSDTHHVPNLQNISLNGFQVGVSVNYKF